MNGGILKLLNYGYSSQDVFQGARPHIPGNAFTDLAAYGMQDAYLSKQLHIHECFICTGKHCCRAKLFCCEKCTHSQKIELNLCCQDQIPTELTDLLLGNIMSLITGCRQSKKID